MLISNDFTVIQIKPYLGFQNLGCHCKILGVILTPKNGLKTLLYLIHKMLSAMQEFGYDLQLWFDHRLSLANYFFRFISTRYLKRGKEKKLFSSRVIYQ